MIILVSLFQLIPINEIIFSIRKINILWFKMKLSYYKRCDYYETEIYYIFPISS